MKYRKRDRGQETHSSRCSPRALTYGLAVVRLFLDLEPKRMRNMVVQTNIGVSYLYLRTLPLDDCLPTT